MEMEIQMLWLATFLELIETPKVLWPRLFNEGNANCNGS